MILQESVLYRGRFAPTPSGPLHFGSLVTALASWLDARAHDGEWWLRIDDIDPPRQQAGAIDRICYQLESLGLCWDKKILQSSRHQAYAAAIDTLLNSGNAFYCRLSRRQLAAFPQGHPGRSAAVSDSHNAAVRLCVCDHIQDYSDLIAPAYRVNLQARGGAFVIRRRDGLYAYHLACALDDADFGMTHVIRGADLLAATPQQCHLLASLGRSTPLYGHLPLVVENGVKLGKSLGSAAIDTRSPGQTLWRALAILGQRPPASLENATVTAILDWGVIHWEQALIPSQSIELPQA